MLVEQLYIPVAKDKHTMREYELPKFFLLTVKQSMN